MHVTDCRICCTNRLVKWSLSCNPHGIDEQGGLKTCLRWERHSPDTRVLDPRPQQKGLCASLLKQRSVLAGITVKGWNFKWDLKENSTKIVREWVGEGNVPTSPFIFPLLFFFSSNSKSPTLAKWSMSKEQTFKLWVVAHSIGTTPWKKKKKGCGTQGWVFDNLTLGGTTHGNFDTLEVTRASLKTWLALTGLFKQEKF